MNPTINDTTKKRKKMIGTFDRKNLPESNTSVEYIGKEAFDSRMRFLMKYFIYDYNELIPKMKSYSPEIAFKKFFDINPPNNPEDRFFIDTTAGIDIDDFVLGLMKLCNANNIIYKTGDITKIEILFEDLFKNDMRQLFIERMKNIITEVDFTITKKFLAYITEVQTSILNDDILVQKLANIHRLATGNVTTQEIRWKYRAALLILRSDKLEDEDFSIKLYNETNIIDYIPNDYAQMFTF